MTDSKPASASPAPRRRNLLMALGAGGVGVAAAAAALAIGPAAASAAAPTPVSPAPNFASVLYDTDANATIIVSGQTTVGEPLGPGLAPSRGALRQEPSGSNVLGEDADDYSARVGKINASALLGKTADQMAAMMRRAINGPCTEVINGITHNFGCKSHLVTIDEVSPSFANPSTGGDAGLALHFSEAMAILAHEHSSWGGSYASHVGVYVDAGVTVAIELGHGRDHNLSPDGRPQYAVFTDVMPGLAKAGALWLEMYKGVRTASGTAPLTAAQWRALPTRFAGFLKVFGGGVGQLHFLFSNAGAATSGCPDPQACDWSYAATAGINREILSNGPGEYRLGDQAAQWLMQFDAYFPPSINAEVKAW